MNRKEIKSLEGQLYGMFSKHYKDLKTSVELMDESKLILSFCWDRYNLERWKNEKSFFVNTGNYQEEIEKQIIPYFKKLISEPQ